MKKPIKLGIIGLGRAGYSMHLPEMKDKGLFDIYAVCDVEPDRLEKMKNEYGAKTYTRVEDIVRDPEIEVIDIATRSSDHFAHAISALNAGKTVFLEKPISETYEEAKRLLRYTDKSLLAIGEYLGFSSQSHFTKAFRKYTTMTPGEYRKGSGRHG